MVVAAAALAVLLTATLVYLRTTGSAPSSSVASHITPHPSPLPPGYAVLAINTTTLYVLVSATSSPQLYETVDGGLTWRRLTVPIPQSERLATWNLLSDGKLILETWDRSDAQIAHAYLGDATGWSVVTPPISGGGWPHMLDARVGFFFVSGQFASATGPVSGHFLTIYRTVDSGGHWDVMLQLDDAHPNAGGLSIAEDHFVGFTDATQGWLVSTAQPYATVCGPTGWTPAGRLFSSEDGGQHWTERRLSPLPDGSAQLEPPVMIRASAGYMLATLQPYVGKCPPDLVRYAYATMDGGLTWTPPRRLPTDFLSTLDGVDWWATDGSRLFRSRDQGVRWTAVDQPRLPARDVALGELFPVGGDTAWSFWEPSVNQSGRIALLRTTDGGATWRDVKLPAVS